MTHPTHPDPSPLLPTPDGARGYKAWGYALALILMASGSVGAAELLPPPTVAPRELPPIPSGRPTGLPPIPGVLPPSTLPPSTDAQAADSTFDADRYWAMLDAEAQRLQQAVHPMFSIVVLRTDEPVYQQYVANGLLRVSVDQYAHNEHGLQATVVHGGKMNGQVGAICYVMAQPERAKGLWSEFIVPMGRASHPQSGAAYLMGHEVGHCLDQFERQAKLGTRGRWEAADAAALGLYPEAVRAAIGPQVTRASYYASVRALSTHPMQRQFEESVADAFGTMWLMKLGGSQAAVDIILKDRARIMASAPHHTTLAVQAVAGHKGDIERSVRIDTLWPIARRVQQEAGLTPEAIHVAQNWTLPVAQPVAVAGTPVQAQPVAVPTAPQTPQIARWVVTAKGPVAYDAQGREVPQEQLTPKARDFRDLRRFGQ